MSFHIQQEPPEVFRKKGVLKNFAFHRKTPVLESIFNKVPCLQAYNFIKRDSNVGAFLWNLRNF